MPRVVNFRQSLIKTCYSKVLEKFVRIYLVEEETAAQFFGELDLAGLTKEEYAVNVVQAYLAEPSAYSDLDEEMAEKLTWELYDLILDGNPYLDPDNLEAVEIPTPRKTRKRKKKLDLTNSIQLYTKVKETLDRNIVGQDEAVAKVVEAVGRGLLRSEEEVRPICSLLLCGETGVGKTELARQLASAFGPNSLIKLDCSEYADSYQIARLTGAPHGYTGYDEQTVFERYLDESKYQVLLLDEFEKANRSLHNLLLGILEDGTLSTAHSMLSFKNCVILLTSNLGSKEFTQEPLGFLEIDNRTKSVLGYIKRELPVEFVSRLTDIVLFRSLTREDQEKIAGLEFEKLRKSVQHLVKLTWAEDAPRGVVAKVSVGREKNARLIRKYMERIQADISQQILSGKIQLGVEFRAC